MIVFTVLLSIGLLVAITLFVRHKYSHWRRNGIPYAKPISFPFGSIKGAMRHEHICDIFDRYYHQFKGTGPFVGLFVLLRRSLLCVDMEFAKTVLVKNFQCFETRGVYYNERDDPLSAHLFALDAAPWRKLRSKLTPTFTSGKMKFMYGTITAVARRFQQVVEKSCDEADGLVEMQELLGRFSMDVIGTTAFGIDCNCLADSNTQFQRLARKAFRQPRHHPLVIFTMNRFRWLARAMRVKELCDDVSSFFTSSVHQTVEYREREQVHRNDFMDILIRLKNEPSSGEEGGQLSLNEVAAQAFVFLLAGYETSATTMTFALYELAANPEVQAKVRLEIDEVLRRYDGEFTYEAMMDMKYLEQTIYETLRKYPPIPALSRQTTNAIYVPEYDYTIPENVLVWIPTRSIHMDPDFFPDPERFDPDRFSAEQCRRRNPLTFLAFGGGPRNCIGIRFGMMQVRIGLATLLRNFQFAISPGKTSHPLVLSRTEYLLSPEEGMWLDVRKIDCK